MIPQFPEFKKIELSDKEAVEKCTKQFPPYSDFNFTSMWSWDTQSHMGLSILNENLVVSFRDYLTDAEFFSFIGTHQPNETAAEILRHAKERGIVAYLKLIPEEIALLLDPEIFMLEPDPDNFDYICETDELRYLAGAKFKQKRNEVNFLLSTHPAISAKEIDLHDEKMRQAVVSLADAWKKNKSDKDKDFEEREEQAFVRLLSIIDPAHTIAIGVYHEEKLLAFMVSELVRPDYAVGHASKADTSVKGTNAYLMKATSEILAARGRPYFNYEQDLGLQNLRDGKRRFRPTFFLKKYIVRQK